MQVTSPRQITLENGQHRIELQVGNFDLWFEGSLGLNFVINGEAMASAALLPAMVRGEDLELPEDFPLDPLFLKHLDQMQDIFLAWQLPLGIKLRRAAIHSAVRSAPAPEAEGVLSYFSGGVDGTYTAMRNRKRIKTAVLLRGIDMQLDNSELWISAHAAAKSLADHFELRLVTVATNLRFLGYHNGLKWASHYQGAGLATIGYLLGHREVLVAATSSLADLDPYGSHPLTDPLWSSANTKFVHDGAVPRTEKIRSISADPVVMEVLRVCWHDAGYNCGKCGKCLRTMVALHLLGVKAPTFPPKVDWRSVGKIRLSDPSQWSFFRALQELERERPDPSAHRALRKIQRASLLTSGLRNIDAALGAPISRMRKLRKLR